MRKISIKNDRNEGIYIDIYIYIEGDIQDLIEYMGCRKTAADKRLKAPKDQMQETSISHKRCGSLKKHNIPENCVSSKGTILITTGVPE